MELMSLLCSVPIGPRLQPGTLGSAAARLPGLVLAVVHCESFQPLVLSTVLWTAECVKMESLLVSFCASSIPLFILCSKRAECGSGPNYLSKNGMKKQVMDASAVFIFLPTWLEWNLYPLLLWADAKSRSRRNCFARMWHHSLLIFWFCIGPFQASTKCIGAAFTEENHCVSEYCLLLCWLLLFFYFAHSTVPAHIGSFQCFSNHRIIHWSYWPVRDGTDFTMNCVW